MIIAQALIPTGADTFINTLKLYLNGLQIDLIRTFL